MPFMDAALRPNSKRYATRAPLEPLAMEHPPAAGGARLTRAPLKEETCTRSRIGQQGSLWRQSHPSGGN